MTFTDDLWHSINRIYSEVLAHPFLKELTAGDLNRERFVFYMKQDALYLKDFSRALATIAARASERHHQESFLISANNALIVERALHEGFFEEYGVTLDVDKAPGCFTYTNYLLALAAAGSFAEAAAGVLPCFWIYLEVGREIRRLAVASLDSNPYRRWIETYSAEQFEAGVRRTIGIIDEIADAASDSDRQRMRDAFERASRLEWMFWDSAYRLEQWPPAV